MVIGISVIIGFIVIFQSMYTAVMERTREIGILKSLGASKFYIVNIVLRETVMLAIGGIIVGVLLSLGGRQLILQRLPVTAGGGDWIVDLASNHDCYRGRSDWARFTRPTKPRRKIRLTLWPTNRAVALVGECITSLT